MIASWRSATGRLPTIASATFGPTPVTVSSSSKNPSSSGRPEPVQRLLVLAHEVVGVQLEPAAGLGGRQDGRRGEHAVADPADLDDERIGRDGAHDAVDRRDHAVAPSGPETPSRAAVVLAGQRLADRPVVGGLATGDRGDGRPIEDARPDRVAAPLAVGDADRDGQGVGGIVGRRHGVDARGRLRPSGRPAPCRPRRSR